MKILGRPISENAEKYVEEIIDSTLRPISFYPIDRSISGYNGFAKLDSSKEYEVHLWQGSPCFEVTLLHEMMHILQYENGFPVLAEKKNAIIAIGKINRNSRKQKTSPKHQKFAPTEKQGE